jgi:TonB family protein
MTPYLNYLVEANLGLSLFLVIYYILFRTESDFSIKRYFLLTSILASLLFPVVHLQSQQATIPSLQHVIPTYWLQEVVVGTKTETHTASSLSIWLYLAWIYSFGIALGVIRFLYRMVTLSRFIGRSNTYTINGVHVFESTENQPSFSFFNFVFIGQADALSNTEKEQIILHESEHSKRLHSFDILLTEVISIFFWFNPLVFLYKTFFVQLHEFEADARAAEKHGVNNYCSLLAKVAILSANIPLANHFNNSLTLKRIEMMRTLKTKTKSWKLTSAALLVSTFFFIVACQDQVMDDVKEIARGSSMATEVPGYIQTQIDAIINGNPDKKFVVIETSSEEGKKTLDKFDASRVSSMHIFKTDPTKNESPRSFVIFEYNESAAQLAEATQDGDVFLVVEKSAAPRGGMDSFYQLIAANLKYPETARLNNIEGKVFIEFIIQTDGSLTDFKVLKGVSPDIDNEAIRVISLSPPWEPATQKGRVVKQRMVLPISFSLAAGKKISSVN